MNIRNLLFFVCALFLISGCESEETMIPSDESAVTADIGTNVILCIYADLQAKSIAMQNAIDVLIATPTQANLDAARQAWRNTRTPWEMSEAFLYGPVSTANIDPNVDSWPLERAMFDSVYNASFPITQQAVANFPEGAKGFHAIEYIIFGDPANPTQPSAITGRRADYLRAAAADVVVQLSSLYDAWKPEGGNFVKNFTKAGTPESQYDLVKDAVDEIILGLIGIANEVGTEKIEPPFAELDLTLEESHFSSNSVADFRDNILGLKAVYTGICGTTSGKGVTHLVEPKNAALDASVRAKIDAAVAAIEGMTPTFADAIHNNKTAVQTAIDALETLTRTLEDSVRVLIVQ